MGVGVRVAGEEGEAVAVGVALALVEAGEEGVGSAERSEVVEVRGDAELRGEAEKEGVRDTLSDARGECVPLGEEEALGHMLEVMEPSILPALLPDTDAVRVGAGEVVAPALGAASGVAAEVIVGPA